MPVVSIVVPFYGALPYLDSCLAALERADGEPTFEVIVVNDGWPDAGGLQAAVARPRAFRTRLISRRENRGFAYTCNEGAAAAAGEWLVFLNVDTIPQPGWLSAMLAVPRRRPQAAVVGSRLLYPHDGRVQHVGACFDATKAPRHLYYGEPGDLPFVRRDRRVQWATGACLLLSRRDFEAAGAFDVGYGTYSEDADLCFTVRHRLGGEVWVAGDSVVYHFEGISAVTDRAKRLTADRFRLKWDSLIVPDEYQHYEDDGFARPFLELLDAALVPLEFAMINEIVTALGLHTLDAQTTYAASQTPEGVTADLRRLRRQGRSKGQSKRGPKLRSLLHLAGLPGTPARRRRALNAALGRLLQKEDVDLYTYNLGSLYAARGESEVARGLLLATVDIFERANRGLAGRAAYKLALLATTPGDAHAWLTRAVRLYPGHRAAAERLAALEARTPILAADETRSPTS